MENNAKAIHVWGIVFLYCLMHVSFEFNDYYLFFFFTIIIECINLSHRKNFTVLAKVN